MNYFDEMMKFYEEDRRKFILENALKLQSSLPNEVQHQESSLNTQGPLAKVIVFPSKSQVTSK